MQTKKTQVLSDFVPLELSFQSQKKICAFDVETSTKVFELTFCEFI